MGESSDADPALTALGPDDPPGDVRIGQIASSVGRLLGGDTVNRAARFVAAVVLARALTPATYGLVNVGIAISGIALIATSLGLPDLGSREVALAHERSGWLGGHVATARVLAFVTLTAIGIPLALIVWPGHTALLLAGAAMGLFMAVQSDWLGRGLEQMSVVAVASAAGGLSVMAAVLVLTRLSSKASVSLAAFAVGEAVYALLLWLALRRVGRFEFGLRGMPAMVSRARHLALSSFAIYIYLANLDTIILAATHSDREAGFYSAAYRVFLVINVVGIFGAYSILPPLTRMRAAGRRTQADELLTAVLTLLAAYGLLALGFVELAGGDLLRLLFGDTFRAAAPTFVLLVSGVAWYAVGYPAGYSLIADGRNSRFMRGAITASALNVGLDFALIPPLGMRGAGLATMVAFVGASLVWLKAREVLNRELMAVVGWLALTNVAAVISVFTDTSYVPAGVSTLVLAGVILLSRARGLAGSSAT
jgi:O-antigen/teichoic acid export membrane protein